MRGQSLIELLIAIGVFVVIVSVLVFFILDSYSSARLADEITKANFLAEEGMEATKSIRNNNWQDLAAGFHGLIISGGRWIFQGNEEDISNKLSEGVRKITIEDIGVDRKKITSQVIWQFAAGRAQKIEMISYLTNWQKVSQAPIGVCTGNVRSCGSFSEEISCFNQDGCSWNEAFCGGVCTPCSGLRRSQCSQQEGCSWLLICYGSCSSCGNYLNKNSCQAQLGCSWTSANCGGIPVPCESYSNEIDCAAQLNCRWIVQ